MFIIGGGRDKSAPTLTWLLYKSALLFTLKEIYATLPESTLPHRLPAWNLQVHEPALPMFAA
jgi:hypothetical protein